MRFRQLSSGLALFLLVTASSCRPDDPPIVVRNEHPSSAQEATRVTASVRADRLRIRSLPYLDGDVVAYLMTGDVIVVESRTEWNQELDSMDAPWYFVRSDAASGWTYGGFLTVEPDALTAIPVNPALPPPRSTGFNRNLGPIDAAELPEILLPVFGFEGDTPYPEAGEGSIVYDPESELLIIPFSRHPESRLAPVLDSDDSAVLTLVADSSAGESYEHRYSGEDIRLFSETVAAFPVPGKKDAIVLPFYRLATLESASWEFYAFAGDDSWPVAVGRADITPSEVSLLPVAQPDPTRHSPRSRYSRGDICYGFGIAESAVGMLEVAMYHDSGEYRDGKVMLVPVLAQRVEVGKDGRWSARFTLGPEVPEGRCWVATGKSIEGAQNLRLFITSVNL